MLVLQPVLFNGFLNRGSAWAEPHITAKWSTSSGLNHVDPGTFFSPSFLSADVFSALGVQVQNQMIPLILLFPPKGSLLCFTDIVLALNKMTLSLKIMLLFDL